MASRIFMGDMPEIMEDILNHLDYEFYSLYSCTLVNRHWCKLSIPILWQDPFSFKSNSLFISQYFPYLDESGKFILNEYGINIKSPNTLFNYARFLKVLNLTNLENKIREWVETQLIDSKLDYSLTYRIVSLLFKLFVENGAILHKLNIPDYEFNSEIFYSLGRNVQFLSQLQDLSLGSTSETNSDHATALLRILTKNSTKVSVLKLEDFYCCDEQLVHALVCFIRSQEQLRLFSFIGGDFYGISSALESQKKSLQEVIINYCDCSNWNEEFKAFMNYNNLKILRIKGYDIDVRKLEISLNTLEVTNNHIYASNIVQILEKSGPSLQRLKLESKGDKICEESILLETLKSFCPNITYLNISYTEFSTQLLELISNLQKLQFLTLKRIIYIQEEELKIRVMQLAKLLPLTLQYLDLRSTRLIPYIYILLNHCDAPLKKLLINHLDNEKNTKALIKFCVRNGTLNYVGLSKDSVSNNNFKKEVEGYVRLVPYKNIIVNC